MRNRKPSGVKRACRNFNGLLPPSAPPASPRKAATKSNPWFKRGTLFGSAVDVLRRGHGPARVISDVLIGDKVPKATRKQTIDLRQPSWLRNGGAVVGKGARANGD
jgi:hypothetical protein